MTDDYEKIIKQALRDGDEQRAVEVMAQKFAPRLGAMIAEARRRLDREESISVGGNVIPLQRRTKGEG